MNPDNNNPQTGGPNLQKLEEDLKTLEVESQNQTTPQTEAVSQQPAVVVQTPPAPETVVSEVQESNSLPDSSKKNSPLLVASIVLVVLALLAAVAYIFGAQFLGQESTPPPSTTACTMEAKLCPDGSYVGRTGPNCEFTACPASTQTPTSLPTMTATPSGTPTMTPTGTPTSTPTSSPSASPVSI